MAATDDQQPRARTAILATPIELVPLRHSSPSSFQQPEVVGSYRHAADQDHDSIKSDEVTGQEDVETVPLRFVI
jgi:hypothetical protein